MRQRSGQIENVSLEQTGARCKALLNEDVASVHVIFEEFDEPALLVRRIAADEKGRIFFYSWRDGHNRVVASVSSPERAISQAWFQRREVPSELKDAGLLSGTLADQYRKAVFLWANNYEELMRLEDDNEEEGDPTDDKTSMVISISVARIALDRFVLEAKNEPVYGDRLVGGSGDDDWRINLTLHDEWSALSLPAFLSIARLKDAADESLSAAFELQLPDSPDGFNFAGVQIVVEAKVSGTVVMKVVEALHKNIVETGWVASGGIQNVNGFFATPDNKLEFFVYFLGVQK